MEADPAEKTSSVRVRRRARNYPQKTLLSALLFGLTRSSLLAGVTWGLGGFLFGMFAGALAPTNWLIVIGVILSAVVVVAGLKR